MLVSFREACVTSVVSHDKLGSVARESREEGVPTVVEG